MLHVSSLAAASLLRLISPLSSAQNNTAELTGLKMTQPWPLQTSL